MAGPSAATNFLTPEDYALALRRAEQENQAGLQMNQAPRHWTQALAGALNQGVSGYREGQARERWQATQDNKSKALAALLAGDPTLAQANPLTRDQAFQWQANAPQREFQRWKEQNAKETAPLERRALELGNQAKEAQIKAAGQPKAPKWIELGTDAQGQKFFGTMDAYGNIKPYSVPAIKPNQLPEFVGQGVNSIPPPPPGVNAQEYYKQASKELAKASVASRQSWPSVNAKIENALGVIDGVLKSPAFERSTSVITGPLPSLTADARNFDEMTEQLRGQAFVQAFQDIKGGGAITEAEGKAATQALARLRSAQVGSGNFKKALSDFRREMLKLREIAAAKAGVEMDQEQPTAQPTEQPKRRRWTPDKGLE